MKTERIILQRKMETEWKLFYVLYCMYMFVSVEICFHANSYSDMKVMYGFMKVLNESVTALMHCHCTINDDPLCHYV